MRLAKYLAHAGIASRRGAEVLIDEGRVSVGGQVVVDPAFGVEGTEAITVDGVPVRGTEKRVVVAVHKPVGYVSTSKDTHGRRTVLDLLVGIPGRLYPVGRLDADSTGLLLLTNDGALAYRLTHPSFEVPKTYKVTLQGNRISQTSIERLRAGVRLDDGMTAPARVRRSGGDGLEITIHEGRKHQVKRMCEAVGHPVSSLQRVAFGPLTLSGLAVGRFRVLTEAELAALRAAGT